MIKTAIVVFSEIETHEGLGRVVNALQTAREFKETGDEVQIIFNGGAFEKAERSIYRFYLNITSIPACGCGWPMGIKSSPSKIT
jgi:hypothetical protein